MKLLKKNYGFHLFGSAEYIIIEKCIESIDYIDITTNVKNSFKFLDDYLRSAATNIFWYKD